MATHDKNGIRGQNSIFSSNLAIFVKYLTLSHFKKILLETQQLAFAAYLTWLYLREALYPRLRELFCDTYADLGVNFELM